MAISRSRGFTLIELIAVVLILGLVASVAVPRFVDLSSAAREASVKSVAGALGSGSAINFSTYVILTQKSQTVSGVISPVPITQCTDAAFLLEDGLPANVSIEASSGASAAVADMSTTRCDVISERNVSVRASFILHGVNPTSSL